MLVGGLGALILTPVVYRIRTAGADTQSGHWVWPTWWMLVPLVIALDRWIPRADARVVRPAPVGVALASRHASQKTTMKVRAGCSVARGGVARARRLQQHDVGAVRVGARGAGQASAGRDAPQCGAGEGRRRRAPIGAGAHVRAPCRAAGAAGPKARRGPPGNGGAAIRDRGPGARRHPVQSLWSDPWWHSGRAPGAPTEPPEERCAI